MVGGGSGGSSQQQQSDIRGNIWMLVIFFLGYLSCYLYVHQWSSGTTAELLDENPADPTATTPVYAHKEGRQSCPDKPSPLVSIMKKSVPCICPTTLSSSSPNSESDYGEVFLSNLDAKERKLRKHISHLKKIATRCVDTIKKNRMGMAMMCPVLSLCGMEYLASHPELFREHGSAGGTLMDYGYDAMEFPLTSVLGSNWVFLTAYLPQDTIALPAYRGMAKNIVFMSPPILHRLKSWFATSTLLDIQLVLRLDEILTYCTPVNLFELVGNLISMAKKTYMILPCTGVSDMTDHEIIHAAVDRVVKKGAYLGIQSMKVEIKTLAVFSYKTCVKELLEITLVSVHRRVRPKWCYYPLSNLQYDLYYSRGQPHEVVMTSKPMTSLPSANLTTGGGDQFQLSKTDMEMPKLRKIVYDKPMVSLADVVAWGVVRDQRECIFYDMLTHPNTRNPILANWVLTNGARVARLPQELLSEEEVSEQDKTVEGMSYAYLLKAEMCVFGSWELGIKFRKEYVKAEDGRKTLGYADRVKRNYYFAKGVMYSCKGNLTECRQLNNSFDMGQYERFCAVCADCLKSPFSQLPLKSSPTSSSSTSNVPCEDCYQCIWDHHLGHGMPLMRVFVGCTDMEAVNENSVADPQLCYMSQTKPLERPSRYL